VGNKCGITSGHFELYLGKGSKGSMSPAARIRFNPRSATATDTSPIKIFFFRASNPQKKKNCSSLKLAGYLSNRLKKIL
jgi:hypothetical protein